MWFKGKGKKSEGELDSKEHNELELSQRLWPYVWGVVWINEGGLYISIFFL